MSEPPKDKTTYKPHFGQGERRSAARLAAAQALYQMDLTQKGVNEVIPEFLRHWMGKEIEGDQYKPSDAVLFKGIVEGVLKEQTRLDPLLDDALANGWPLKRIETLMRAILRCGALELVAMPNVPVKVVISEYVDVSRAFFGAEETAMINAVLDKLAREVRPTELPKRS